MNKALLSAVSFSFMASAATLDVYLDKAVYTYRTQKSYIGFSKVLEASCESQRVPVVTTPHCPTDDINCRDNDTLRRIETERQTLKTRDAILQTFLSSLQLSNVSQKTWLNASRTLAKEQVEIARKAEEAANKAERIRARLQRRSDAKAPVALQEPCKGEVRLVLPPNAVAFSPRYRADIEGNKIRITQELVVRNRSGIDIDADTAHFYNSRTSTYIAMPRFRPHVLSDEPPVYLQRAKAMRTASQPVPKAHDASIPAVQKPQSRTYILHKLHLPSDGLEHRFEAEHYLTNVTCADELHAYADSRVLKVCRFNPKSDIENAEWQVFQGKAILNERAKGRYEEGRYALYIANVPTFRVVRKPYVPDKKEDGFFETIVRKTEGTVLHITNSDDKPATLRIVERIPVSSTDKITVKLLRIEGASSYTLDKKTGKVRFDAAFKPFESKTFRIIYTVEHPKEVKVY